MGEQGYLVLPAALDGELCRRARDHMWSVLSAEVPRLRRADPQTWGPIEPEEPTGASRLPGASEAYFTGGGHRFHVKCACEALFLELFPRALWTVAEQLLGEGQLVMPQEPDADGLCAG